MYKSLCFRELKLAMANLSYIHLRYLTILLVALRYLTILLVAEITTNSTMISEHEFMDGSGRDVI
jgi:hypothetical protein